MEAIEIKTGYKFVFVYTPLTESKPFTKGCYLGAVPPENGAEVTVVAASLLHENHYYLDGYGMQLPVPISALKPLYYKDAEFICNSLKQKFGLNE